MQRVKHKFSQPDHTKYSSLQSCIRTNDLELVGDGTHLTYFEMLGTFSFGNNDYALAIELWHSLVSHLGVPIDSVHVHPDRSDHAQLWTKYGYDIIHDTDCKWSDGNIGGYCCELYSRGIEIGNLVNTLDHSVDVGFGWERLHMIVENVARVDQTSLFGAYHPVVADHVRALTALWDHGVAPGGRGRHYVCQRLLRRMLPLLTGNERFVFDAWLSEQKQKRDITLSRARKTWRKHKDKSPEWWFDSCGLMPEEIKLLQ